MKVYIDYEDEHWITDEADPEDSWSRDSYGGNYWVTGVSLSPGMRDFCDTNEEFHAGDEVWVVYAVYGTGDTFGSDGGYGQVIAVTKYPDLALEAEKWAQHVTDEYSRKKGKVEAKWPVSLGDAPYPSWTGYFEWLQEVRVEKFLVHD